MSRATVRDIAEMVDLHPNTIRNWTDKNLINHKRDFKGWRWFPQPLRTVREIRKLLNGETVPKENPRTLTTRRGLV